ncbi:PaaI family thioesterase [Microbispora sp. H11081]|uniref:PaaI family thioesterase n=1 Tax=Microbispora sp. H11081 TaxID=2729107 RepID=UPI001473A3F0|nr:PaaI family thioesterase [Microbispora sp. H11081]
MTNTVADPQPIEHPWLSPEEVAPERASKRALADAVRRIVDQVALIDVSRVSAEQLAGVRAACETAERALAGLPSLSELGGPQNGATADRPLIERGPISGRSNALAPPLEGFWVDGEVVRCHAVFRSTYEGPAGNVHGGVLLAAFDEVLAFGQVPSGHIGMTGTITVKLLGPVPTGERVDFEAGTLGIEGRKVKVWARARVGDRVVADASAICILVRRPEQSPSESTSPSE